MFGFKTKKQREAIAQHNREIEASVYTPEEKEKAIKELMDYSKSCFTSIDTAIKNWADPNQDYSQFFKGKLLEEYTKFREFYVSGGGQQVKDELISKINNVKNLADKVKLMMEITQCSTGAISSTTWYISWVVPKLRKK